MFPRRMIVALAVAVALAPPTFGQSQTAPPPAPSGALSDPERLLTALEQALGGAETLAALGDVELTGTLVLPDHEHRWHALVRREPFAVREELSPEPDAPDAPPTVSICDGRVAWRLQPDGSGRLLVGRQAIAALDVASSLRLLLDPRRAARRLIAQPPGPLPIAELSGLVLEGDPEVERVLAEWPHGAQWLLYFDPADGRLLGLDSFGRPSLFSVRNGSWARLGPLNWPTRRRETQAGFERGTLEFTGLTSGLVLPGTLFAGDPRPRRESVAEIAALHVVPTPLPLTAYLVLDELRLQGGDPIIGLIDTGASRFVIEPDLAQAAGLPAIGQQVSQAAFAVSWSPLHLADRVQVGAASLEAVPMLAADLPPIHDLPRNGPLRMLLGGERLLELAPVFDLRRGRLLARARPAVPLSELAGLPTFTLPFERRDNDALLVEVEVNGRRFKAHLDTGMPQLLRLPRSLLEPLGLPTDAASWRARGAIDFPIGGAGGVGGTDLLVQLDEVAIGPVRLQRPFVLIAGLGDPVLAGAAALEVDAAGHDGADRDAPASDARLAADAGATSDALVGASLLLIFSRVGLDPDRQCFELLADARELQGAQLADAGDEAEAAPGGAPGGSRRQKWVAVGPMPEGPPPGADPHDWILVPPPDLFLGILLTPPHDVAPGGGDSDDPRPHDLPHVQAVLAGTAAEAAGLQQGDRLLEINGHSCRGVAPAALWGHGPLGSPRGPLVLRVLRKGVEEPIDIAVLK